MKPKVYISCTVMRRQLIAHGTLVMATGEYEVASQAWETKECGMSLFTEAEKASGVCRSCASGWTHPHNYRVGGEAGGAK